MRISRIVVVAVVAVAIGGWFCTAALHATDNKAEFKVVALQGKAKCTKCDLKETKDCDKVLYTSDGQRWNLLSNVQKEKLEQMLEGGETGGCGGGSGCGMEEEDEGGCGGCEQMDKGGCENKVRRESTVLRMTGIPAEYKGNNYIFLSNWDAMPENEK